MSSEILDNLTAYTDTMEEAYQLLPVGMKAEADRVAAELREICKAMGVELGSDEWWRVWVLASIIQEQCGQALVPEGAAVFGQLGSFHRIVGFVGWREARK